MNRLNTEVGLRNVGIALLGIFLALQVHAAPEAVPGEYVVKFRSVRGKVSAQSVASRFGLNVRRELSQEGSLYLVKGSDHLVNLASLDESIEYIEPNYIYHRQAVPNDPDFGKLWGLQNVGQLVGTTNGVAGVDVGATKAWDITTGSPNVVVAVIDTGVNYKLDDLKDNAWMNQAEANGKMGVDDDNNGYVDDIYGYDFANKDADPMDDQGHGTHCAGTISASGDNNKDVVGVAWKARIMALKFLTASGNGSLSDAVMAIDYATNNGAHIMSNSWGGGPFSQAMKDAIDRSAKKGVLFVAASGNGNFAGVGQDNDKTPMYPANYKSANVISVAAIDHKGAKASFSNYGLTSVHVGAPGVKVVSLGFKGGLATMSGTSMATPHVSGIAALIKAKFPDMKPTEIKDRLIKTAQPLTSLNGKTVSGGIANAYNALANIRN